MKALTIVLILSALILAGCAGYQQQKADFGPVNAGLELTEDDIFAQKGFVSTNISVFGVELGDSITEVLGRIGEPDRTIRYDEVDSINMEYEEVFGLNRTGLLVNFVNGTVTRFTIMDSFNEYLVGSTKMINYTKNDIYFNLFGNPIIQDQLTFFRRFTYPEQGLEVFVKTGKLIGFSLVLPTEAPEKNIDNSLIEE